MDKRYLYVVLGIGIVVLGGVFWVWGKKIQPAHFQSQKPVEEVLETPKTENLETNGWKTYKNDALKLNIRYPSAFRIDDTPRQSGHVVSFLEFDGKAKGLSGQPAPGYFPVISIGQWSEINDFYLIGGWWEGQKKYTNFQDFLADSAHTHINVTSETSIDGIPAYILSMPGEIGYEAIMFEYSSRYYRISFPWTQKPLSESIKNQFIYSLKIIK
jgi:hypothetical protein